MRRTSLSSSGAQQWRTFWPLLLWLQLITTSLLGAHTKTAMAIMNCIQARDSCMNNTACHEILEVVPRVCGAEKVACSTVTITKCQAALRTLQAFPYFYPTCLCREPMSDPACNTFRDYLFDHPCSFVKEKEKDPYPVDALPTCDYALDVCKKEQKCMQLLRDFRNHCKADTNNQCKMEDGERCHDAWTKMRLSPMFGCICPNSNGKCDRMFREVNYNPCVATDPLLSLNGTSSALFSHDQHYLAKLSPHMSFSLASLFPPRRRDQYHHVHHSGPHHRHPINNASSTTSGVHPHVHHSSHREPSPPSMARTESHLWVEEVSTPISSTGSLLTSSPTGSITVQVISSSSSSAAHATSSLNSNHQAAHESQLETPMWSIPNSKNIQQNPLLPPPPKGPKTSSSSAQNLQPTGSNKQMGIATLSNVRVQDRSPRLQLQSTCLTALQGCRRDSSCRGVLEQVLHYCDPMRCRQETCMRALEKFYREVEPKWALDVAFCMCRKTDNRHDQCRLAQEQLHPVCAQRGDLGVNPPSCHSLAESCRAENDCRFRLEEYEQACAVDSVTRKCAGPTIECRNAIIRILGTKLRTSCACNGTDFTQLYDCLGWQRILWVNPCVVEAQRDYHRQKSGSQQQLTNANNNKERTTASSTSTSTTTTSVNNNRRGVVHTANPNLVETISSSSFEGQMPGGDVLSTTIVHPPPPPKSPGVTTPHHTPSAISTSTSKNSITTTILHNSSGNNNNKGGVTSLEMMVTQPQPPSLSGEEVISEEVTTGSGTTTISTTTMKTEPTTTLVPPRYCRLHQGNSGNKKIREGQAKRLYRDDIPTCSEVCTCELGSAESVTSCKVLDCLDIKHCYVKTEDEYQHLQPTYIAHRGKCLCYSGRFICERPPPDTYTLDNGVFLFVGFSKKDEELLHPITRLGIRDVVEALQKLINPGTRHHFYDESDGEESAGLEKLKGLEDVDCRLGRYKIEGENLIINATVSDEDFTASGSTGGGGGSETLSPIMRQPNDQLFQRERKSCLPVLHVLRDLINKQHPIIHSHSLLSILKLAVVQDNIPTPEPSSASRSNPQAALSSTLFYLYLLLVFPVLLLLQNHQNHHHHQTTSYKEKVVGNDDVVVRPEEKVRVKAGRIMITTTHSHHQSTSPSLNIIL